MWTHSAVLCFSVVSFCSAVGSDGPAKQMTPLLCENKEKSISCTVVRASVRPRDIRKLGTKNVSGRGQSTMRDVLMWLCLKRELLCGREIYILAVDIFEPLLRNYACRNRLGSGNLRAGAPNFDLMANCIIWKDNLMASIYMCLISINLHWEKQR